MILKIFFWIFFVILIYTYAGYPILLFLILKLKKLFRPNSQKTYNSDYEPNVCLFITAFNEKDYVRQKVRNSFELDYPREKIQYVWVTDGSDDGTPDILCEYKELEVYHQPERKGKMHAMNRGMQFVKAPIVIFSDTNTILNSASIREIVNCFANPQVGCVAGEKRIFEKEADVAAAAGEGIYWKYESWIKNMDAELNTAVGAAGELFAIRKELFEEVEEDTILDDFIISLRIAKRGYKIAYTPNAYAEETASLNVKEELKRKIRIAAGGVQTLFRLKTLLNPFRYGLLTWQYFSHKVLRWTLAPVSLFLLLPLNAAIILQTGICSITNFYFLFLLFQLVCYFIAIIGWHLEYKMLKFKMLFIPYYFVSINYAAVRGIFRYAGGNQPASWEKSKRAKIQ